MAIVTETAASSVISGPCASGAPEWLGLALRICRRGKVTFLAAVSRGYHGDLLRSAVVRRQAASGLLAQVTQGVVSVAIILVVRAAAGSLALAGAAVSAVWVAGAIARPLQGRAIDRGGARRLLVTCGVVHAAALMGIVGVSRLQELGWLVVILAALAGLALPPISTSMRSEWSRLVPADERTACYSFVYLLQELAILAGPLLFAALSAAFSASVALIAIAGIAGSATLVFASAANVTANGTARSATLGGSPLRAGGLRALLAVALLVGGVLGALQVGVATFADGRHCPAVAGLLLAALSVGGIIGAAIYGARHWRTRPWGRLALLLVAFTTTLALIAATTNPILVAGLMLVAGIVLNPTLSTLSLLLDQHLAGDTVAEAFGWLSMALASGTGGGAALTAALTPHQFPPPLAFAVAAIGGAGATLIAVGARPILDRHAICVDAPLN